MIIASLLESRQEQWRELEELCDRLEVRGRAARGDGASVLRFASLYRAACADLAMADSYHLPPATVAYLHRLVARAHNNLYRSDRLDPVSWVDMVFRTAPQRIFADPCVRVATLLFFGLFALAIALGYQQAGFPGFAEMVLGEDQMESLEKMYEEPIHGSLDHYVTMAGFYIKHNTGIGLQCFAFGVLLIPCLITLAFNAIQLGTAFGYMSRLETTGNDNFLHFVTAHGPFELTAIALAGGAGLRLGMGLFSTGGLSRIDSLYRSARLAVPIMVASAMLFFLAALTEGFVSPSSLPYVIKALWAILSAGLISFYFVVLGFPRDFVVRPAIEADRELIDPLADEEPVGEYRGAT
ncbi:MAG: stage II sporulation protein M [Planctomycetaceae bacterium]|nr:MAG: stage II sporulation protein M [Planctomycetaceae bacterium]